MAIEKLSLAASDFHVRGGIQYIGVAEFSELIDGNYTGQTVFVDSAGNHSCNIQQANAGSDLVLHLLETRQGSASLTQTGSKDGSTIMYEQTLTFFAPNVKDDTLSAIEKIGNEQAVVVLQMFSGEKLVMGASKKYKDDSDDFNIKNYVRLTSVEVSTGAALGDDNGVTVTMTCNSGEVVRSLSSTLDINTTNGTITVAKA